MMETSLNKRNKCFIYSDKHCRENQSSEYCKRGVYDYAVRKWKEEKKRKGIKIWEEFCS